MKIIYIDRRSDFYLNGFINNLDRNTNEIFLLDLMNGELCDINKGLVSKLIRKSPLFKIKGIKYVIRYYVALVFLVKFRNEKWDVSHFLGLKRENFWLLPFLRRKSKKIIITIYGRSTYLNKMKRFLFKHFYRFADVITIQNIAIRDEFRINNKSLHNLQMLEMPLPINHFRKSSFNLNEEGKKKAVSSLGLSENKIRISCSSTISSYDQHFKIIDSISKIKGKNNVQLMFLLTYGGTINEKQLIIDYIQKRLSDISYKIFEKALSDEEMINYRKSTDLYINMRSSDQIAGAILESLAAGSLLISGSWLNYSILDNLQIYYEEANDFVELTDIIDMSISNYTIFKTEMAHRNSEIIIKEFALENVIQKWNDLYNNC